VSASDEEAFSATRIVARSDGISVEPAVGVAFAGLFKLVQEGIIKPNEVVVVNCSGHTMPVELQILEEDWQRQLDVSARAHSPTVPQEGLISAIEGMDRQVKRIAVIEDNVDAARLVKRVLEARGTYEVHLAHDGESGLALVREIRPELVVTDLMMPGVDGFRLIDALKADPALKDMQIVVVTAKELTARERAWLKEQVNLLLQKGGSIDEDLVEALVEKFE
jgi:threonine synthase